LCISQDYTFGITTVTGALSYNWIVPNGFQILSGQGAKDILTKAGTNPTSGLTISVRANNGCGSSPVSARSGISIISCARLDEASALQLQVYPNPASDRTHLVFQVEKESEFALRITDASGRVVLAQTGNALSGRNELDLDIGIVSKGIYFIELRTASESAAMRLVVMD
jgi:hypothetical protein